MQTTPSEANSAKPLWTVLVVEDDQASSDLLCFVLRENGITPLPAYSATEAAQILRDQPLISAALIDLSLPDGDGIDILRDARQIHPELPCYVLTVSESVDSVVGAMKAGATDYMVKPFQPATLIATLKQAILVYHAHLPAQHSELDFAAGMRSWRAPKMRAAVEAAFKAATSRSPVLISGMPATGKKSIAKLIHEVSGHKTPLPCLDAARLKPEQLTTELFGSPNPEAQNWPLVGKGLLNKPSTTSLLIENVETLNAETQKKLLTWLTSNDFEKKSACRIITTTTTTRAAVLAEGRFRKDLWYALSVYHVKVPRLMDRPEDLSQLCEDIVTRICIAKKLRRPSFTRKAFEMITDHTWPGNLSELQNVMEHAVSHTMDGLIGPSDLPQLQTEQRQIAQTEVNGVTLGAVSIDEIAKIHLLAALEACGGNRRRAANRLNISTRTVYNMIRRYGIDGKKRRTKPSPPESDTPPPEPTA
jgi:DNA-binding NtrC family response regulator